MSTKSESESETQVCLKLLIDKTGKRILYAEAEKKFIDFLFTILSLPVGAVIKHLSTEGMVGPLGNLYRSVDALNTNYFEPNKNKATLLNPFVAHSTQFLQINSSSSDSSTPYYTCISVFSPVHHNFTFTYGERCPSCNNAMTTAAGFVQEAAKEVGVGYVKGMVTYMVMDNLTVKPMSSMSSISVLKEFNVEDVGNIEEKLVYLDNNEGVKLLRASFHSHTVLTDVFLHDIDFP